VSDDRFNHLRGRFRAVIGEGPDLGPTTIVDVGQSRRAFALDDDQQGACDIGTFDGSAKTVAFELHGRLTARPLKKRTVIGLMYKIGHRFGPTDSAVIQLPAIERGAADVVMDVKIIGAYASSGAANSGFPMMQTMRYNGTLLTFMSIGGREPVQTTSTGKFPANGRIELWFTHGDLLELRRVK